MLIPFLFACTNQKPDPELVQARKRIIELQEKIRGTIQSPTLRKLSLELLEKYKEDLETPSGLDNWGHIQRLIEGVYQQSFDSLKKAKINPEVLVPGILASDIGKTRLRDIIALSRKQLIKFPGLESLKLKKEEKFKAFLLHEEWGIAFISERLPKIGEKQGLSTEQIRLLIEEVGNVSRFHSGPAIEGSWWKRNFEAVLESHYPNVKTREAWFHAVIDRHDQSSLLLHNGKLGGGTVKILNETWRNNYWSKGNKKVSFAEFVKNAFLENSIHTSEQIQYLFRLAKTDPKFKGLDSLKVPRLRSEQAKKVIERVKKYIHFKEKLIESVKVEEVVVKQPQGTEIVVSSPDELYSELAQALSNEESR